MRNDGESLSAFPLSPFFHPSDILSIRRPYRRSMSNVRWQNLIMEQAGLEFVGISETMTST